jgi:hypothetical protein
MLPFDLVVSVLVGFAVFQGVASRPSHYFHIDLQSCQTTAPNVNRTAVDLCLPVCQPVLNVQRVCRGSPECACSTAPPEAVQSCLQCHLDAAFLNGEYSPDLETLVRTKVTAYSLLCQGLETKDALPVPETPVPSPSSSHDNDDDDISRREGGDVDPDIKACVYGLPEIVIPDPSSSNQVLSFTVTRLGMNFTANNPWIVGGVLLLACAAVFGERKIRQKAVKS